MTPPSTSDSINAADIDELDRQVLHCLQIWPRAPWTLVGEVLGIDPMTAARRWQSLEESGNAWISVAGLGPNDAVSASIDVRVKPNRIRALLQVLMGDPSVHTVRSVLGEWSVMLDWRGDDLIALDNYLNGTLAVLPGVRGTRTHIVTGVPLDGSTWRLRALSQDQVAVLRRAAQFEGTPATAHEVHDIDRELFTHVSEDGRATLTSLAKSTNASVATVRRHLEHMLGSKALVLRCDVARPLSGWPIAAHFLCTIEPGRLPETLEALSRIREVRAAMTLIGPYNLRLNIWLRSLPEITALEGHLAQKVPHLKVGERSITSRMSKHMHVPLDDLGRRKPVTRPDAA